MHFFYFSNLVLLFTQTRFVAHYDVACMRIISSSPGKSCRGGKD